MKEQLIKNIRNDLKILPYEGENKKDYCCRLIYSAIADWLRMCILDKTNENCKYKSKLYLRLRGEEILKSFLQIFPDCCEYFYKDSDSTNKNPINIIRERMIANGELIETNEGLALSSGKIKISNTYYTRVLGISYDNNISSGITKIKKEKNKLETNNIQIDNDIFFRTYFKKVKWDILSSFDDFEYLNSNISKPPYKCWQSLNSLKDNTIHLSRLHVNEYLSDYYWVKKELDKIYISKVNDYYSEFEEIRRFILWQRKNCNNPVAAHYCKKDNVVILNLYAKIPYKEQSVLDTYCWPLASIQNKMNYVIPIEIWGAIEEIIVSLEFKLSEVEYGRI